MIKSFFKLTQKEKRSSVYFVLFVVLVFLIKISFQDRTSQLLDVQSVDHEKDEVSIEKDLKHSSKKEMINKKRLIVSKKIELNFPDSLIVPQSLSVIDWFDIGFSKGQAKGLMNYFNAIGWVSSPDEIQKIYVLNENQKNRLIKKIKYQKKDFNLMSSDDLLKIKGIGQVYGSRILNRRELLGGYNNYGQFKEIYGLDSILIAALKIKTEIVTPVNRIKINHLSFEELSRHPYLSEIDVKKIIGKRSEKRIANIDELFELIADSVKVLKLKPYLSYD